MRRMPESAQTTRAQITPTNSHPESYYTIAEAAKMLGIHAWALRRAINRGIIPAYTPFNKRRLVRLTEIVAAIDAAKLGGAA